MLIPLRLISTIREKIFGKKIRGIKVGAPKTRTVGQQEKDFNEWANHVFRPKK